MDDDDDYATAPWQRVNAIATTNDEEPERASHDAAVTLLRAAARERRALTLAPSDVAALVAYLDALRMSIDDEHAARHAERAAYVDARGFRSSLLHGGSVPVEWSPSDEDEF